MTREVYKSGAIEVNVGSVEELRARIRVLDKAIEEHWCIAAWGTAAYCAFCGAAATQGVAIKHNKRCIVLTLPSLRVQPPNLHPVKVPGGEQG